MENQGKSDNQMKSSYIGAFVGFIGMIVMLTYLLLS
jgi:hypothetical protein